MIGWPRPRWPVKETLAFHNGEVVDTGVTLRHQTIFVKLPVLIAVGAIPLPGVIAPLVGKAHRDTVVGEGPQFLDQPILQLPAPLALQKSFDSTAALRKLGAVAPLAVDTVSEGNFGGIAVVPPVFRRANLLLGGFQRKGRQGRTLFCSLFAHGKLRYFQGEFFSKVKMNFFSKVNSGD